MVKLSSREGQRWLRVTHQVSTEVGAELQLFASQTWVLPVIEAILKAMGGVQVQCVLGAKGVRLQSYLQLWLAAWLDVLTLSILYTAQSHSVPGPGCDT